MDRYDPYTDKFLRDTQYNILSTNLAEVGTDCISRQAAIEVIDSFNVFESRCDQIKLEQMIGELPPVNNSEIPNSSDTISRAKAIEALTEYGHGRAVYIGVDTAVGCIDQLPPAPPKTGKWILDRSGAYCCSECMEPCAGYVMMKPRDKFCKMCGSRNEVTE